MSDKTKELKMAKGSVKTKELRMAKEPAKYWSMDEFNRSVKKVSKQIEIIENETEFFVEVDGEMYYIPSNARLIIKSAATIQRVFK